MAIKDRQRLTFFRLEVIAEGKPYVGVKDGGCDLDG
jgi:hypothetical protein